VLLTFFSPSAYNRAQKLCQGEESWDFLPLPWDTAVESRRFVQWLAPKFFVTASYDIWPNLIWALKKKGAEVFLVSALLAPGSGRIKTGARWFFRRLYSQLSKIYPVDDDTADRFYSLLPSHKDKIEVIGDTRCDAIDARLKRENKESLELQALDAWLANRGQGKVAKEVVFLAGSTYGPCDKVVLPAVARMVEGGGLLRVVYVPHETDSHRLEGLKETLHSEGLTFALLSDLASEAMAHKQPHVVVVDRVGLLLSLYERADFVFVGGSFYAKIHNTYEPAAWGKALAFGPKYHNAPEADRLVRAGGAEVLYNEQEAYQWLTLLAGDQELRQRRGRINKEIFANNLGASRRVAQDIVAHLT
jgi:3-deoxy-D-manno-octulosonic-acid transferase